MPRTKTVRGTMPGLTGERDIHVIDGDTHISKWVEESRRIDHDQSALPRIGQLIKPGQTVYDVGAFIGDHSCYYASLGAWVVAFEPDSCAWKCLAENARPYGDLILPMCMVLGSEPTLVDEVVSDNAGASFWVPCERGQETATTRMVYTIDAFAGPLQVDFIKIDAEGWEVAILQGAEHVINRCRPTMLAEVNQGALARAGSSGEELRRMLVDLGYVPRDLYTWQMWDPGDTREQFDVVCLGGGRHG